MRCHYRCELLALVLTYNCSQIPHILLITLNFLVCPVTEYFQLIFSLGIYLD